MIAMAKKICIYIPAYNVASTLPLVIDRIPQELKNMAREILVVDNASHDSTYLTAVQYKRRQRKLNMTILRNKTNLGYGGSQKKAYQYAIDRGYDIVVMLHGDAQYAPEKVPLIIEPLIRGRADMVFGSRMRGNPLAGGMPVYKYIGNKALTAIENIVLRMSLSEFHSGMRAFSCAALKQVPFDLCSDNYHFDTDILIQFKLAGMRISEVPIPTYYGEGSKSPTIRQLATYSLNILRSLYQYLLHRYRIRRVAKFDL